MKDFYQISKCILCENGNLKHKLSLKPSPLANDFVSNKNINQPLYPLQLSECEGCGHIQLCGTVDAKKMFDNYAYVSGTSKVFVKHFADYADTVIKKCNLKPGYRVLEIGSNDGTLLKEFKSRGMEVLGIDPAKNICDLANQNQIETINGYFDFDLIQERKENVKYDLITANNVMAHSDKIKQIVIDVRKLLSDEGSFVFEVSYLVDVIDNCLFDIIYHEHFCMHYLSPLINLFNNVGMEVKDVEKVNTHGGSIRVYAGKINNTKPNVVNIKKHVEQEGDVGLFICNFVAKEYSISQRSSAPLFKLWQEKLDKLCNSFAELLEKLSAKTKVKLNDLEFELKTKKFSGYGAPAKATTLLHQLGIKEGDIDYIIDDSPLKQNKYSPGLHIPIRAAEDARNHFTDYRIIFAWNFADSIIKNNLKYLEDGGIFIVPLPEIKLITKDNYKQVIGD